VALGSIGLIAAQRGEHADARARFARACRCCAGASTRGTWPCCC
jgi:hypothetical protein